jgi:carboxylesterase type B
MANDYIFFCPTRNATMNAAKSAAPLWTYAFNQSFSFPAWGPDYAFCNGHVCHGSELPYLFNTAQLLGYKFTPQETELTQVMSNYWANFAMTGNPNLGPFRTPVSWPQYNSTNHYSSLNMSPPNYRIVSDALVSKNCDFWDQIGYRKGWAMFDPRLILKMKMDSGIATKEEMQLTDD